MITNTNRPKIKSLQVFRGLAALAVVFFHCAQRGDIHSTSLQIPLLGYLGVDFFFVLSGFIIMYAHLNDPHTFAATKRYLLKRITRIYPVYLPLGLAIYFFAASSGPAHASLMSTIFLIPADKPVALPQAWTLVHEVMFYAIFLLFFISWRYFLAGLIIWASIIFVSLFFYSPTGWLVAPLSWINLEFMLGVGTAVLFHKHYQQLIPLKNKLFIVGCVLFLVLLSLLLNQPNETPYVISLRLIFAFGLALFIIGFALHESTRDFRWPHFLLLMGNASYSLYLIHFSVIAVTFKVLGQHHMSYSILFITSVVLSIMAGLAYYFILERPLIHFFQKHLKRH